MFQIWGSLFCATGNHQESQESRRKANHSKEVCGDENRRCLGAHTKKPPFVPSGGGGFTPGNPQFKIDEQREYNIERSIDRRVRKQTTQIFFYVFAAGSYWLDNRFFDLIFFFKKLGDNNFDWLSHHPLCQGILFCISASCLFTVQSRWK